MLCAVIVFFLFFVLLWFFLLVCFCFFFLFLFRCFFLWSFSCFSTFIYLSNDISNFYVITFFANELSNHPSKVRINFNVNFICFQFKNWIPCFYFIAWFY